MNIHGIRVVVLFLAVFLVGCAAKQEGCSQKPTLAIVPNNTELMDVRYYEKMSDELAKAGYVVVKDGAQCQIFPTVKFKEHGRVEHKDPASVLGLDVTLFWSVVEAGKAVYNTAMPNTTMTTTLHITCGDNIKELASAYSYPNHDYARICEEVGKSHAEMAIGYLQKADLASCQ